MGEAGRKLTIRMPDSDRLAAAEVTSLHLEPGGRASVGAPVMTLRAHRREHVVRSPRPGRIVPLVGPGDRVRGGDPLYVLNLDEAALARRNSEARAEIATERAAGAGAAEPERIQVVQRGRSASPGVLRRLLTTWGGPLLAIAFYIAACFAFLPVLGAVSDASAAWGRALLLAGVAFLGLLIFRMYAPRFPGWPRTVVRVVAIAWVGIAAVAVLHRPFGQPDLTIGGAGERVAGMLWAREEPGGNLVVAPEPAPMPEAVESSGVLAGLPEREAPAPAEPRTRLAGARGPAPEEHGVTVRPWGRQNPAMASGEPPRHAPADAAPPVRNAPSEVAAAGLAAIGVPGQAGSPPPGLPERIAAAPVPVQIAEAVPPLSAGDDPAPAAGAVLGSARDADDAPPRRTAPVPDAGAAPAPLMLSERLADAPTAAPLSAPVSAPVSAGLAVVEEEVVAAPPMPDPAPAGAADAAAGPEPMLTSALRAGSPDWMEAARVPGEDQPAWAAALRPAEAAPDAAPALAAMPVARPGARPGARPAAPPGAGQDSAPAAVETPPLPAALAGAPDAPAHVVASSAGVPSAQASDEAPAPAAAPGGLAVAMAPSPAPAAPAAPEALAERRLLFLYYDDPRLETHPQEGDQWLPAIAPEAAEAIRSARVAEVREVVEVTDWCTAEDPTAALSDRIRLLEVRLDVDPTLIERLEAALPVLAGAPPGFFHNQAPLLGGAADAPLMQLARAFLEIGEQGAPDGRYFDSEPALARALEQAGCRRIEWNGGDGPANEIGRALSRRTAG